MKKWLDSIWLVRWFADCRAEWKWRRSDRRGQLPARTKRRLLRRYAQEYGLHILVETGSYLGDTVATLRREFNHVYSIELSAELARQARRRFRGASNVTIVEGDSGTVLHEIVRGLHAPALFWLDGHFSGGVTARGSRDTPVLAELETVLSHPQQGHVLLIDDAGWLDVELGGTGLEQIQAQILAAHPHWVVDLRNDILRAHAPPNTTVAH
jgi:hypothetical protein